MIRTARAALLLVALLAPRSAVAQRALDIGGGVSVSSLEFSRIGTVTRALSGPVLGAEGRLGFKRFELRGRYLEGTLSPSAGAFGGDEDLADLRLTFGASVGNGITVGIGPHLRALIAPAGTASWTRLELNGRIERELVPRLASAEFELWYALTAESNILGGGTGATGGTLGVLVEVPGWPVSFRVAYSADRATYASGGTEFLDGLELGLRLRRP